MNYFNMYTRISAYAILLSILLSACATPHTRLNHKLFNAYPNDWQVKHRVWHLQKESVLALQCNHTDFRVAVRAYRSLKGDALFFEHIETVNTPQTLPTLLKIPNPQETPYYLEIAVYNTEIHPKAYSDLLYIDAQAIHQQVNIRTLRGRPVIDNYLPLDSLFVIEPNPEQTLFVSFYPSIFVSAPRPDSHHKGTFRKDLGKKVTHKIQNPQAFKMTRSGVYFIQTDTLDSHGMFFNGFAEQDYPAETDLNELIQSTRYIATRDELRHMQLAANPKQAFDNFWLGISEEKAQARQLIREYYNRIQEANFYFTTYKKGWKTDRGIIYVVFGLPDEIRKTGQKEFWYYKNTPYRRGVEFTFQQQGSQFILERNPYLEDVWEGQIMLWRRGEVKSRRPGPAVAEQSSYRRP